MNDTRLTRIEDALTQIVNNNAVVTFTAVANHTGLSLSTLYRDPEVVALINEHRTRAHEARTLSGLAAEISYLRTSVEAIAERVRHHEELLRKLERRATK